LRVLAEEANSAGGDNAIVSVDNRRLPELHPLTYMHGLACGAEAAVPDGAQEARVVFDPHYRLTPRNGLRTGA
jgi:hypothetical protein